VPAARELLTTHGHQTEQRDGRGRGRRIGFPSKELRALTLELRGGPAAKRTGNREAQLLGRPLERLVRANGPGEERERRMDEAKRAKHDMGAMGENAMSIAPSRRPAHD
jgi:hypothetical protein